jgi:hypothetical protein
VEPEDQPAVERLARYIMRPPISCGGEMKVIAFIVDHVVVDKILRHLKRRAEDEKERGPPGWSGIAAVS